MGRRKIEIKAIKDDRNRSVTFLKRKGGLFKKAHELSVLCSVDVAVIIFGHNKKLYEFSSCDMDETLNRYQYFGPPHERKGPEDFTGKRDDDDDEDETTPAPEEAQPSHQNPSRVPPHVPTHPGFQHVNHAPSASPPVGNGVPFVPRHGTPQPQGASRPSSRNHIRRVSSNLGAQHRATPPPHPQNGFTYVPNPSVYNPSMNQQPRPGQFPPYRPTPGPHPQPHPQSLPQSMPPHTVPVHSMPQHIQAAPQHMPPHPAHSHPLAQQAPVAFSQPAQPPMHQMAPGFMPEQGRNAILTTFGPEQPNRAVPFTDAASGQIQAQMKREGSQTPPQPKPLPSSKSQSIFTPIDDRGSVLARHFPTVPPVEPPRGDQPVKHEPSREDQSDGRSFSHPAPPAPPKPISEPQRTQSVPAVPDIKPASRTNSGQLPSKRPQLKVQIPSENSDRGSATAESTSRDSAGKSLTPAKVSADGNQPGVVLPPPSPSAGPILSAGAQGPPNPFARPPPPGAAVQNNTAYNNNNNNNNIETPISALPSRFVSDALLPSPSSFFPEWGFGRSGPDTNMLPSPLTFPTPAVQSGPGFAREDEQERKRKSPESGSPQEGATKKTKT